ncbi:MAG: HU family DNA-binding protein [Planctomycetota bacterium]
MNTKDFIREKSRKCRISEDDVKNILTLFWKEVTCGLKGNKHIAFRNFGTFSVVSEKGKWCRNPQTGQEIKIPEQKKVRFKPSKQLKQLLRNQDKL